jgi:orotate phosphoribosyltransferase
MSKEMNVPVCFNRKEVKDHGEGGSLIGAMPKGKVLIVDDVISSGLAIRESLEFLKPFDVELAGALVTLDRQEIGQNSDLSASAELQKDGLNIFSVVSLDDLLDANELIDSPSMQAIRDYRSKYQGKNV